MIKNFEVSGTEYDMGYVVGREFKDYLQKSIEKYEEKLKIKNVYKKVKNMEEKLKIQFPKCLEEIYGRADGANISRDATLLMFFPEIFRKIDGCTTVILKKENGNFLFSHNEDDKNYTTDNVALVKYKYSNYWIVGYTMAEKLTGSSFAFNSYGLVFSSNYIFDTKIDLNNISRYIMVRDVMNSKSIEETIEKLNNSKVASAFSLNILDTKKNVAINVEKDIDEIYVTNIEDRYARANHFTSKEYILPEDRKSTKFRDEKSNELIKLVDSKNAKIEDLINILNYETDDYNESIFKDSNKYNDKSITVANFSFDNDLKNICIMDYLGDYVFRYNLK